MTPAQMMRHGTLALTAVVLFTGLVEMVESYVCWPDIAACRDTVMLLGISTVLMYGSKRLTRS